MASDTLKIARVIMRFAKDMYGIEPMTEDDENWCLYDCIELAALIQNEIGGNE